MPPAPHLPPYGHMGRELEHEATFTASPTAWASATPFRDWVEAQARMLADHAWPAWNPASGVWEGAAAAGAAELTRADLLLMRELASEHDRPSRHRCGRQPHRWWFENEDDLLSGWRPRYEECLEQGGMALRDFSAAFADGAMGAYVGGMHLLLKSRLQRPRPFQAAYLLGEPSPSHRHSRSAWSPSAVSGHALQGFMGCARVLWAGDGTLSADARGELLRMAVDIGDRRVFAGLHYPSDNAMSWRVALDALAAVSFDAGLHSRMGAAIRDGAVWKAMLGSAGHAACIRMVEASFT